MPLYTGAGDDGETGLFGNRRVPKDDLRIEAYGTVDELNSQLGLLRSETADPELAAAIERIQSTLFEIGADLATEGGRQSLPTVEPGIRLLEQWIDASEATLPQLRSFILPGGCREAALLHIARTVARRAERRFWTLARSPGAAVPQALGIYLNRVSDLLFSWARRANQRHGARDVPWSRQPG